MKRLKRKKMRLCPFNDVAMYELIETLQQRLIGLPLSVAQEELKKVEADFHICPLPDFGCDVMLEKNSHDG